MSEYSKASAKKIFSKIAKRYDLNNTLLSLGIHHLWKRRLVKEVLKRLPLAGVLVDLCTGTGDILRRAGSAVNGVGVDFCGEMLQEARKKIPASHQLLTADVCNLPLSDNYADAVSVAFGVRNLSDLDKGLREIKRITKGGGNVYILEFGKPQNKLVALLFGFYSRYILPLIGGVISGDIKAYRYLHRTSWEFPCGDSFVKILKECGYKDIEVTPLTFGIAYLYRMRVAK